MIFLLEGLLEFIDKIIVLLHIFDVSQVGLLFLLVKFQLCLNFQFLSLHLLVQLSTAVW